MSANHKRNNNIVNKPDRAKTNRKYKNKDTVQVSESHKYYMLPLIFVLCIIPFIVRVKEYNPNLSNYAWFPNSDVQWDFFLYYKQWSLIVVASFMAIIIAVKAYYNKTIKVLPIMIPLALYMILCILSTIFSEYRSFSIVGSFEQFESIFALLGYGIIVFYAILFVQTEKDIKYIMFFLIISVLLMSILGVFQYMGHDLYASEFGKRLILPNEMQQGFDITFQFPEKIVYLSLYNPNYVGSYIALFVPLAFILIFFEEKKRYIPLQILIVIGLVISAIGSDSLSGIVGVVAAFFLIPIFMWRIIVKRWYIVLPSAIVLVLAFVIITKQTDVFRGITSMLKIEKTVFNLTDIRTEDEYVSIEYKGSTIKVAYTIDANQDGTFTHVDEDNNPVKFEVDATTGKYTSSDVRFPNFILNGDTVNYGVFNITIDGRPWNFYWDSLEKTYYFVNQYGKIDKMHTAPSSVFTGYESLATKRGYIWSRTIPMLKDYIILGSGPDTYAMVYPQDDYMNMRLNNFDVGILSKPHNMYLQMAVQTGIISLIAFLVFYSMYLVSSVRLYIRGRFNSYYAQVGVAIFISTIAYMITGLANDSSIATAPVFWTLLGIGIAVNLKAKPLIIEERKRLKEEKQRLKEMKHQQEEPS